MLVNYDSSKEIRVVREVRSSRYRALHVNYITRKRTTTKGKPFFDWSYQMAREIAGKVRETGFLLPNSTFESLNKCDI